MMGGKGEWVSVGGDVGWPSWMGCWSGVRGKKWVMPKGRE